ncbi:MAG: autoinducer-2 kinase [Christensenellales bacterium]|jgi:autoinducer 2 (AI-2) kinase|nr:autoinducer-2 kinase [Christensenellaceae bacterium]
MKKYLLALDAGTGSIRAVLFDFNGNQIACVQHEWDHPQDPRYPGSMDFDWVKNWALTCECTLGLVEECGISPEEIAAVSTTCMREGIVLYNSEGKEIWACANVDARSNDEVGELININPDMEREIYKISGETYALGALPRLLWVKNKEPEIYRETAHVSMINDWLIYKLTDVMATEPSNGSTTGIFNLKTRDWDPSIALRCGIKDDIFTNTVECGTLIAHISEKAANETGLAAGTPVVVGGGDAQLGSIGVGVVDNNQAAIFGGSFWQYEYNTSEGKTDDKCRVRVNCHAVPGMWQYEALAFKPGMVMRWFRDAFCQHEKEIAKEKGVDAYDIMNEKASKIPAGSYGMLCTFSDVMNFINWRHASPAFMNFDFEPDKFNKYTFYRAIMENTALVAYGHVQLVKEAIGKQPETVVFAGGASKSDLWCQILADVLGVPVKVPVVKEATALGCSILAGYGVGIYPSISQASKELVKWENTFTPNIDNHRVYMDLYSKWRDVYAQQLKISDQGLLNHMWKAPGLS